MNRISKIFACLLLSSGLMAPLLAQPQTHELHLPGTESRFLLQLIPAGTFTMGSPAAEANRDPDEGPQHKVKLDAFYMSQFEVTYDLFSHFQIRELDSDVAAATTDYDADAVTRPTPQYQDYTHGMGKRGGFPAVGMTQQAALRFCQWLYEKTGEFYRLPTEAEWEYACRAGSETAFSYGDDPADLGKYGWYWDNSGEKYQKVGQLKPNAFGLYDMHGNVSEYTLDEYQEDYFAQLDGKVAQNPYFPPESRYRRTIKGGAYDDDPEACRCAARMPGNAAWQARDPQIPKSQWWNPDSPFLGFRLVKPVAQPSAEEVAAFFAAAIEYE